MGAAGIRARGSEGAVMGAAGIRARGSEGGLTVGGRDGRRSCARGGACEGSDVLGTCEGSKGCLERQKVEQLLPALLRRVPNTARPLQWHYAQHSADRSELRQKCCPLLDSPSLGRHQRPSRTAPCWVHLPAPRHLLPRKPLVPCHHPYRPLGRSARRSDPLGRSARRSVPLGRSARRSVPLGRSGPCTTRCTPRRQHRSTQAAARGAG